MDLKDLAINKEFLFHRLSTLIILILTSSAAMMSLVIPFLNKYFESDLFPLLAWAILELTIVGIWLGYRTVFPKGVKSKETIVIAITTEDKTQKTRITKDFAREIRHQLDKNGLGDTYHVIVLHNHLAKVTRDIIAKTNLALSAKDNSSEDKRKLDAISKRMNAKLFIHGDLVKRDNPDSKYYLGVGALIKHRPVDKVTSAALQSEFGDIWKREITILEKDERNGFKSNAENVFFTSSYIIGLATLVDDNHLKGIQVWESLEEHVSQNPALEEFLPKIKAQKGAALILQSQLDSFTGNIARAVKLRQKLLKMTPNDHLSFMNEAIKQVKLRNDPELALEYIGKAKAVAGEIGAWRYSEFYLLVKLDRIKEALQTYSDILSHTWPKEEAVVYEVIRYNEICYAEDNNHLQSNFIIGAFLYKKLDLPVQAYDKLEVFTKETVHIESWEPLRKIAEGYLKEIDEVIGVK